MASRLGIKEFGCVNALAQVDIEALVGQHFHCSEDEVIFAH